MDFTFCYNKWKEIFDDDVFKVWKEEPTETLKNLSMLKFCFDRELQNLEQLTKSSVSNLRKLLKSSESSLLLCDKSEEQTDVSVGASINCTSLLGSSGKSNQTLSNNSGSIIISDEEIQSCAEANTSPEIKKTHRPIQNKRRKKVKSNNSATLGDSIIRKLKENLQNSRNQSGIKESSEWSFQLFDDKPILALTNSPVPEQLKSDDDLDSSTVIQGTPIAKLKEQSKSLLKLHQRSKLLKRVAHPNKNHTLAKRLCESNTSNTTDLDKENSHMGVTDMISYMNKDEPASPVSNISLNSGMLEEDCSLSDGSFTSRDKLDRSLNSFLAEAQNVPKQTEDAPKVLGKQRKNLAAWTCKECEILYLNCDLNKEQLLQVAKCSNHRGQFKPREETLPGYWDMNVFTPDA